MSQYDNAYVNELKKLKKVEILEWLDAAMATARQPEEGMDAPGPMPGDQKAFYQMNLVEKLAFKAFEILDERLKGDDKALVNAIMSLMLYAMHFRQDNIMVNWWDNQMAGEAILEIVTRMEW